MTIDFSEIRKASSDSPKQLRSVLSKILEQNRTKRIYLSDVLANINNGGQALNIALSLDYAKTLKSKVRPPTWRLKVIRDQWGNPPQPGDTVKAVRNKRLVEDGVMVTHHDQNAAKMEGTYEERYTDTVDFEVDSKGCIECDWDDTILFLNLWGIHGVSKAGITTKPEHTEEPVDCPNGQKLHAWYRRYYEVTEEMYKDLPKIKLSKAPRRGLDPKNVLEAYDAAFKKKRDAEAQAAAEKIVGITNDHTEPGVTK